jgi:hypothetical protein
MQARYTAGSAEANLPCSWHTASTSVTPEFIAGTFAAQPPLTTAEENWFQREGVPLKNLHAPTPARTGRVVFAGCGFEIEPYHSRSPEAEPAYLFLVTDHQGQAQDIAVWVPDTGRLATWRQQAWALGQDSIYRPRLTDHQCLRVWRSPWGWLRVGREGLVPIRPSALPFQLDCAGSLVVADTAYGKELRSMLTTATPRILVVADGDIA